MSYISLYNNNDSLSTIIDNYFIDEYMSKANGSFVKVYLLLLRCLQGNVTDFSLSYLAEKLDETEKDMERAIRYWEKEKLISVVRQSNQSIVSITICNPKKSPVMIPDIAAAKSEPAESEPENNIPAVKRTIHRPNYSDAQIKVLTDMEEVKWIIKTVERQLERLLKPTDVQLVLFLYESLGFSPDLIFYLYDYCVSKNKKSTSYIETVAISWAEEGIKTAEQAEEATLAYNNNYNAVNKAFGLNRLPVPAEKKYMHCWFHEFGFDIPIIEEACNRTVLATGKPDFKYANKILETWHKKGVSTLKDISVLDDAHMRQTILTPSSKAVPARQTAASSNKFNSFPQRKYSDEELLSMEQQLLNNR